MLELLKKVYRRLRYGKPLTSDSFIARLRAQGVRIGEDVTFYSPQTTVLDGTYPWLITIGDHVRITKGVIILTHDYSWSVLKGCGGEEEGHILGASGKVVIGNNVFIGMDAIIMRNVTIGDDVIIGAGSVVTRDCESGWVYGGNPARKLMPVAEYREKRCAAQLREAKDLARAWYERFGEKPGPEVFHEYFMLFCREEDLTEIFREKMRLCGNYEASRKYLREHPPVYDSFEAFLADCGLDE